MSKSIKLKNNYYWDTSNISHNRCILKNILLTTTYQNDWNTTHEIKYNEYKPIFVILRWNGDNTLGIYCIYANRVIEIIKNGNGSCNYDINVNEKKVIFNLNNTGVCTFIECP